MKNRLSYFVFLLTCLIIVLTSFYHPKWQKTGTEATLSWDVDGYYSYLPAFLIYGDLAELNYYDQVNKNYYPTGGNIMSFYKHESGNYIMKYSAGMSLLYLPGFLAGHAYATISDYPSDGYSFPYQAGIHFWSFLVAFIGLWYCRKNLLFYFNDKVTAISLGLIALGTNYLNYATFDAAMSHNYLFTIYSILLYATIKWYKNPSFKFSIVIGLCCGSAALARPSELIAILIPLFWGIGSFSNIKERSKIWFNQFPKLTLALFIMFIVGSIQLIYWKSIGGSWFIYSYEDQGFDWWDPNVTNVLFSYRKGWLIYSPLMLFGLTGFYFLFKNHKKIFGAALLFILINFWIVSAWEIWWYGGGFGQRALVQSYAIMVIPFAAFVEFVLKKNWSKIVFLPLFAFCVFLNFFQTWQAHGGGLTTEEMSKPYFWRIFLNANVTRDDKILLDQREICYKAPINQKEIYLNKFESNLDSIYSTPNLESGGSALFMNGNKEFSPAFEILPNEQWIHSKWLRVSGDFMSPRVPSNWGWRMTKMVVRFEKDGQSVKERYLAPQRILTKNKWASAYTDMKIPKKEFDKVKIFFWKLDGNKPLVIDNLKAEVFDD